MADPQQTSLVLERRTARESSLPRETHRYGTTSKGECPSWHRSRAVGAVPVAVLARVDDMLLLMQNKTIKPTLLLLLKIDKLLYVSLLRHGAWRGGKRPRLKDWGPMLESCRGCNTADLSILMPIMKGPPGGPGCHFIKTRTQSFWALVWLLSCFSMDLQYLSCTQGGREIFHPH